MLLVTPVLFLDKSKYCFNSICSNKRKSSLNLTLKKVSLFNLITPLIEFFLILEALLG